MTEAGSAESHAPAAERPGAEGWRRVVAAVALALPLIVAVYANSLRAPFQFDDRHAIVENSALRNAEVDWSWWGAQARAVGAGHYRPLTAISYAVNIRLGGLDPLGFHLTNVILHWAATAVLMWVLWLLFPRPSFVIAAGLLFAVTPANSEAVNYVAARSSLLVGLWGAVSLGAFSVFRRGQAAGRWPSAISAGAAALGALGLGLGSKEVAVTFPLVWLCYDIGWSRPLFRRSVLWPYGVAMALGVAYLAITGYPRTFAAVLAGVQGGDRDIWVNLWSQLGAFHRHVTVFLWPFSLNVLHDVPIRHSVAEPMVWVGSAAVLVFGVVGMRWLVRPSPEWKTAGLLVLWFLVSLLPATIYPLHVLFQEHREYLPWMGLSGLAGLVACAVVTRAGPHTLEQKAWLGAGVAVLVLLSATTVIRNSVWTDPLRLWSDSATKSPKHPAVRVNLGAEYAKRGDTELALIEYEEAIRLQPDYGFAYQNAGLVYLGNGQYAQARAAFERAAVLAPSAAEPLVGLGRVYLAMGELQRAEDALTKAIAALESHRHHPSSRLAVADALAMTGRREDAARHYRTVLTQEEGQRSILSARAYLGLGYLAEAGGRLDDALEAYSLALRIEPSLSDARFNRANVLLATGRLTEAKQGYEELLADAPAFFLARFNLGRIYEREGLIDEAHREFQRFLLEAPSSSTYAAARAYAAARTNGPAPAEAGGL